MTNATSQTQADKASVIDWTAPLEHVDGTPLKFSDGHSNPDAKGDYFVSRADGQMFEQGQGGLQDILVVHADGTAYPSSGILRVRNVKPAQPAINPEIYDQCIALVKEVNGVRERIVPSWFPPIWDASQAIIAAITPVDPDLVLAREMISEDIFGSGKGGDFVVGTDEEQWVAYVWRGIKRGRELAQAEAK